MENRIARTGDADMALPAGMNCSDCIYFNRCVALFQCDPGNTFCDWAPSRFVEGPSRPMAPTPQSWFMAVLCYPLNGRCTVAWPVEEYPHPHYVNERAQAVEFAMREIREQEPREDHEQAAKLLMEHDSVQVGRIIVTILSGEVPTAGNLMTGLHIRKGSGWRKWQEK